MNENCLEVSLVEELLWKRASWQIGCVFAGVNESGSHLLQIVKQVGWLAAYLPVLTQDDMSLQFGLIGFWLGLYLLLI